SFKPTPCVRHMKLRFAICLGLLLPGAAYATKVRPVELSELTEASELVLFGRIEMGQVIPGDCGNRYIVKVMEAYKGSYGESASVLFSTKAPMTIGSHYVLFLSRNETSFTPLYSTSSFGPGPDPERVRICEKNRPRYTVNIWGVGAFKVTGTYQSSERVAFFDDYMVHMPERVDTIRLDPSKRYDIPRDEGAIEFEALRQLLIEPRPGKSPPN
ncbi:hypothetical protein, partial [Arenimonas soli]|uniref:hypothetical protein n=1 Tax=Arenimonas soli TaxID=2269504 RepID=UPI001E62A1AA